MTHYKDCPPVLESEVALITTTFLASTRGIPHPISKINGHLLVATLAFRGLYFKATYKSLSDCVEWLINTYAEKHGISVFCHLLYKELTDVPNEPVLTDLRLNPL